MGVPAFYRWLSEKYPKCVQDVLEERVPLDAAGRPTPHAVDWRKPNPSGVECDNLYIDMNGIIHPCAHPEQGPQPNSEAQMYVNVAEAVDRLVRVNRPRQLLYLAIDGVAPRAKMNQQRARRFRSAQEARELAELEATVRVELQGDTNDNNATSVPAKPPAWDSNVITPGTTFMLRLADYIRFYVRQRLSTDPCWKHLRVLFSDASLPGEGEHKIMSHVRLQRAQPGYSPNLVHVLHGLDADLIMLGLATHEAHFYISREEVVFGRKSMEMQEQRQNESGFTDAQRLYNEAVGGEAMRHVINTQKPLQRVSLPILREYLGSEFHATLSQLPFAPSLERLLDDVVFLCFFVGNDFLPHLPSLDIRDGALDFLFNVYQQVLPTLDGYLTMPGGNLNLPAINLILEHVGAIEDHVFGLKHANEERRRDERERFKKRNKPRGPPVVTDTSQFRVQGKAAKILAKQEQEAQALKKQAANAPLVVVAPVKKQSTVANEAAAAAFKASLLGPTKVKDEVKDVKEESADGSTPKDERVEDATMDDAVSIKEDDPVKADMEDTSDVKMEESVSPGTRKADSVDGVGKVGDAEEEFDKDDDDNDDDAEEAAPIIPIPVVIDPAKAKAFKENVKARQQKQLDDYASNVVDNVRLHEPGWKDRYYTDKCKAEDIEGNGGKEHLFRTYVMGLVWVMKYYYDGCPSWKFYYPFHYAPFASDLQNIERFTKDVKSFQLGKPFNPVEQLMAVLPSDSAHAIPKAARWFMTDPESPILDFYPKDVPVDPNGKAMPWLWVVLLPFIEEERLLSALSSTITKWTKAELLCNARGLDDGYMYVHSSHSLRPKLANVLQAGKTAKDPKTRLNDGAVYGCGGFSGSLRPPLSNELVPMEDEDVKIPPPPGADTIDDPSPDNLFLEEISPNESICVAFTEPIKLPHKSILLAGAKPPKAILTDDDKRIRKPRINRGASIANMGVSNGKSFQSGYGSMNISSYERDLAQRTGRGQQMNQAGTRTWGSMEPSGKRPRVDHLANPFQGVNQQQQQRGNYNGQGPPQQQGNYNGQGYRGNRGPPPPHQQYQQQGYQGNRGPPPQQYQKQQHHQQQQQRNYPPGQPYQNRPPGNYGGGPPRGPPQQQQQQRGPPYQQQHQQQQHPQQRGRGPPPPPQQSYSFRPGSAPPPPQRSRTSADTMKSLRAQLSSTLQQQNKRPPQG